jgi:hypothetical protein
VNLDNVSRQDWIVGGLALLLTICLFALPWFDISVSFGGVTLGGTLTATDGPDGWTGILAALAAIAVIADLGVERFAPQVQVPMIRGSREQTRFVLAAIAAGFTALKFVFHIHFSLFGWGFYATVIVAAALVYFAMQATQAGTSYRSTPAGPAAPAGPVGSTSAPPPPSGPPAS